MRRGSLRNATPQIAGPRRIHLPKNGDRELVVTKGKAGARLIGARRAPGGRGLDPQAPKPAKRTQGETCVLDSASLERLCRRQTAACHKVQGDWLREFLEGTRTRYASSASSGSHPLSAGNGLGPSPKDFQWWLSLSPSALHHVFKVNASGCERGCIPLKSPMWSSGKRGWMAPRSKRASCVDRDNVQRGGGLAIKGRAGEGAGFRASIRCAVTADRRGI